MLRLAELSVRRPLASLLAWGVVVLALCAIGLGVTGALSPSIVVVSGSESARAEHLAQSEFGPSVLVPILLRGPQAQIDQQGPGLVRVLAARPDTRVLSAWDSGATGEQLRPRPDAAMIVAAVARTNEQMVATYQRQIERTVDRKVSGDVQAYVTGTPSIDRALRDQAIHDGRLAGYAAIAILFVALLLVLRAPVAALALTVVGAATIGSGFGALTLAAELFDIDAVAITASSLVGLALGISYSLMIYVRWRDELRGQSATDPEAAARAALTSVATTGRAILIGGTALSAALVVASQLGPSEIVISLGIGVLVCSLLAIGASVVVMPALLVRAGTRLEALSFPAPRFALAAWARLTGAGNWVVRRAAVVGALVTAILAALLVPAFAIDTGPPSAALLPAGDPARQSFEQVAAVMGPGWPTPFNIVVVSKQRPLTDRALLRELESFQRTLAKSSRIDSVVGPGEFAAAGRQLAVLPKQLKQSSKLLKGGKKDLGKLQSGLARAGEGAVELRQGLAEAASGAGRLSSGSGTAESGAGRLGSGLDQARAGANAISGGLGQALSAARQLRDGAGQALAGSKTLTAGLGQAVTPVKQGAPVVKKMAADIAAGGTSVKNAQASVSTLSGQIDEGLAKLRAMQAGTDDPAYGAALAALQSARNTAGGAQASLGSADRTIGGAAAVATAFADQVAKLSVGLGQLYNGSSSLQSGISKLSNGNARLAAGIDKLAGGGGTLSGGISQLRDGAAALETGLGQLTSGSGDLAAGLSGGTAPTASLAAGLRKMERGIAKFRRDLPSTKDLEQLQESAPGLFDSGYFVLAAIAGARPGDRNQAGFAVNLDRGGTAGQITVIPKRAATTQSTQDLGESLVRAADAFARRTHTEVAVGGPAGELADFQSESAARILPVIVGVAAVVTLLLMVLLRSVVLPAVAVALDLLTTGATFGLLWLLFSGDDPVLGGPGYIDPVSIICIFAAVFGITVVYEVALLQRTREAIERGRDTAAAVREGLRWTHLALTGAALVMVCAFVPLAASDLITIRQLGAGLTIAVVLDALIVRPVLLPAAITVLGRRAWWPTGRRSRARVSPPAAA